MHIFLSSFQLEFLRIKVDESLRKLKAILNKITLDNYYKLIGDLIEQGGDFSSADFLNTLVDELWQKAVTQHHFLAMYTQLVKDLRAAMVGTHSILMLKFKYRFYQ